MTPFSGMVHLINQCSLYNVHISKNNSVFPLSPPIFHFILILKISLTPLLALQCNADD